MRRLKTNVMPEKSYLKEPWLNSRLDICSSPPGGKGAFACEPIEEGEIVTIWGAEAFTEEELKEGKAQDRAVMLTDNGQYIAYMPDDPNAPDHFLNHSCDPNVWMADEVTLRAQRKIDKGEELTADYAMWERDETWQSKWKCQCGKPQCRGAITGKDWRLPELQKRYGDHFLPEINKRISKQKSA